MKKGNASANANKASTSNFGETLATLQDSVSTLSRAVDGRC